jgi:O-acetyl-ADP-ribose deacetylase (regulator of RNase III)
MGCVVTGPGRMECDYIIHAVGPICFSRENMAKKDKELAAAVLNSLLKAEELELRSISLPGTLFSLFYYFFRTLSM